MKGNVDIKKNKALDLKEKESKDKLKFSMT